MADPEIISPRGVPQVRTDWLADVARRLAGCGLDELRALPLESEGTLEDIVDGETWTFRAIKFSLSESTAIELDADLWAPGEQGGRPTLRAGFELAPRWDAVSGGRAVLVRTEIGPRGAVTFDPENWMVLVPVEHSGAPIATPQGVNPGRWEFDGGAPAPASDDDAATLDGLAGLRLALDDLEPVLAGEAVPQLVFGAFPPLPPQGFFGRLRRSAAPPQPAMILTVDAAGPIEVAWTGTGPIEDAVNDWLTLGDAPPTLTGDHLTVRGPAGVLTLSGASLGVRIAAGQHND